MKIRLSRYVAAMLLLVASNPLWAQGPLQEPLPLDPQVKIGKLSNGLTYYIRQNTRPENKVELRLVVNAGSILEDKDQLGLAHFVEHMAFNGTRNFKKNDLVSYLQSIGLKFGNDLNAYTSFDETVYILPIPTDKQENIETGFQVLEDWASAIAFEHEEIDKERGVILEESRLGKGAQDRMQKKYLPSLLQGSLYADRLPIGKDDIIQNFKYDAIKRFYRDWYRPNLMAVVVVGDIEPAAAESLVKKHFEKLKNPSKPRKRIVAEVPPRKQSEGLVITDPENGNSILQVIYSPRKEVAEKTAGDYRGNIVKRLFSQMLSARLQELTQKPTPPFVFAGSSLGGFVRGYESYSAVALVGPAGPQAALEALVMENERARKFGFTAGELERTKKNVMRSMERSYNERDKTESANFAAEYIRHFLQGESIPGIEKEFGYYKEFLDGITLEEVNRYAASVIPTTEPKLAILLAPEKPDYELPTGAGLLKIMEEAARKEVSAYEEKAVASSLLAETPAAGRVLFQKENKDVGYYELMLNNGIRVLLKPTTFKNDQVLLSAFRYGGTNHYEIADRFSAENAATLVAQMGVGTLSPVDLQKALAGKTVNVFPRLSATSEGLQGSSSAADIESLLQLAHLYFTKPRKDEELFQSFIGRQQAVMQNMMANPQAVFQDSLFRILYKNHPRAPKLPAVEDLSKINLDRALTIYGDRFSNANGFTFVLVGAFELDKIKPLLATYLASLPSDRSQSFTYKDAGLRPVRGVVKKEVKKGIEQKSFIGMQFTGEAPYSGAEQLKLQALIEIMNIKLIETLREQMSGTYTGGMYGSLSKVPYENYSVGVSIPCGPENVDKLITATLAEIEKVKKNGPEAGDLAKVKENWKKQYQENLKDNNYWLRQLQNIIELGNDPATILSYESRVDALTTADLKIAAARYFDTRNYVQVVLNPEK